MDMQYYHSTHEYARSKEEKGQLKSDLNLYHEELKQNILTGEGDCDIIARALLDSSLITTYEKKKYNYKIIECGEYYYIYKFPYRIKNDQNLDCMKDYRKINIDNLFKNEKNLVKSRGSPKQIEYKNILRSKFEMQRLIKANEDIFKTFITLTFSENLGDVKKANNKFNRWTSNIKKIFKDFAYVAVLEFQKRGAVHYHLLTNLDIEQNPDIIIPQYHFNEKQYKEMTEKQRRNCFDVKYWPHGYSSVFSMKDINVVGYLSKYMTKDIDNRLWGHRRYFHSLNLKKAVTNYIDSSNIQDFSKIIEVINDSEVVFTGTYFDINKNKIEFVEYKKRSVTNDYIYNT